MLPDSFGLVREHSNVVVLRTFSKAYGLAGLRVGYAVGDPDIITALGKVVRAVQRDEHLAGRGDRVAGRRRRTAGPHRRRRRRTGPGHRGAARGRLHRAAVAGQLRLAPADRARAASSPADSANSRIIVRPYGDDGVRVTVAAPHENDAFLEFAAVDWRAMTDAV